MLNEKAYAKINLGLEVVRKRPDGYHDLSMIMTPISLHDELSFEEIPDDRIIIECSELANLKPEDNLVYKAITLLKKFYHIPIGIKARLMKNIPEQAGLGGGSADAAASLRALNRLWNLGLPSERLSDFGAEIGSDVPFCIYNRTAFVEGRGEKIRFIEEMPDTYAVLVFPDFKTSTAEAFQNFQVHGINQGKALILMEAIASGDIRAIAASLFNDLETGTGNVEIGAIKDDLIASGAFGSSMTGSGSTVFGICSSQSHAKAVVKNFMDLSRDKYGTSLNGRKIVMTAFQKLQ